MLTTLVAPRGAIVHPSVFFGSDLYGRLGISDALASILDELTVFRDAKMIKKGPTKLDPWIAETDFGSLGMSTLKDCRVLVCGRAGVGKSTLINRVFGVPVVRPPHALLR
jgi:hypothetical protein